MPNWLGDAVMGTPILEDIKRKYPACKLTVLCHGAIKVLLEASPYIDDFIVFQADKKRTRSEKKRIYDELKKREFDTSILLTRSFSSAWWFYRAKIKQRIGFNDHWRGPLLTDAIPVPENDEFEHQVLTYKLLLKPLEIEQSETPPKLHITAEEKSSAKKLLADYGIGSEHTVIGINPGAAFGSAKCWPEDRFKALTAKLLTHPEIRIVYFGDNVSKPLVDSITTHFDSRVVNLAGKTSLRTFTTLLAVCDLLVTNDSGPMHVAAALSTPLVAIFGSTNEIKTGPYGGGTVIHKHTLCSPCYLRECPIDFRCMTSISVDDVFTAIQTTLADDKKFTR